IGMCTNNGDTCLHYAMNSDQCTDMLDLLVDRCSVRTVKSPGPGGKTALHIAAEKGHANAGKSLVKKCSDVLFMPDNFHKTPLYYAHRTLQDRNQNQGTSRDAESSAEQTKNAEKSRQQIKELKDMVDTFKYYIIRQTDR